MLNAVEYLPAIEAAAEATAVDDCDTPPINPLTFAAAHEIWQRHMHFPGSPCVK